MRYGASSYGYSSPSQSPEISDILEEPEGAIYTDYEELEMDLLRYFQYKRQKECEAGICDCPFHEPPLPLKTGVHRELIRVTLAVTGICFCTGAFLVLMWPE